MPEDIREMVPEKQSSEIIGPGSRPEGMAGGESWLYETSEELASIRSEELRSIVELTELVQPASPGMLREYYLQIVEMVKGGQATAREAQDFLIKIGTRIEELEQVETSSMGQVIERMAQAAETQARVSRGELALEALPGDKEAQRFYVRGILDRIENSNRDCRDQAITYTVQRLEASSGEMDHEVAEEVRTRLALHDCSELVRQANGWISSEEAQRSGSRYTIGSAVSEAVARHHEIEGRMIQLLLKDGLAGLRIADAWDKIQKANFNYEEVVGEAGLKFTDKDTSGTLNFYTDTNAERRRGVQEFLIAELGGDEAARKSWQLAEKLTVATFETCNFNRSSAVGNDQLAEIIYMQGWRADREKTGRKRGPEIHEKAIPGFGNSWLRRVSEKDSREPMQAENVEAEKIREGDYSYFATTIMTRYFALRELLLNRELKPQSLDKTFLQGAVVYFNTADNPKSGEKCGPLLLRVWWLTGVVDIALANENLEWDTRAFNELEKAVIREELSSSTGTFITEGQWKWIANATNLRSRLPKLVARRAVQGVLKKSIS